MTRRRRRGHRADIRIIPEHGGPVYYGCCQDCPWRGGQWWDRPRRAEDEVSAHCAAVRR